MKKLVIGSPMDFRVIDAEVSYEEAVKGKDIYRQIASDGHLIPESEPSVPSLTSDSSIIPSTTTSSKSESMPALSSRPGINSHSRNPSNSQGEDPLNSLDSAPKAYVSENEAWEESDYSFDEDDDTIDDDHLIREGNENEIKKKRSFKVHPYLSVLVNYARPSPLCRFSKLKDSSAESYHLKVTSLNENSAEKYIKEHQSIFVSYCQKSLIRVYPKAKRLDSSNYNPQLFWNSGCQMAALNFQTADVPFQLNSSRFETNHRYGYILKPLFLRDDSDYNPIDNKTQPNRRALQLKFTIISALYVLDSSKPEIYCVVETFGKQSDTRYRKVKAAENSPHYVNFESDKVVFDSSKRTDPSIITHRRAGEK